MSAEARRWALITGASRGIGAAFANALAPDYNLILGGRATNDLERVQEQVSAHGAEAVCLTADLATAGGAASVLKAIQARGLEIDLLVNNAGVGSGGGFAELPLQRELDEVRLNVGALVELTHGCLESMRRRRRGAIIHVASVAGFQPIPYMATYAATKAFVLHFSLGLQEELRHEGIHVMALCPGPTRTEFFQTAKIEPRQGMQTPEEVVRLALRGLQRRQGVVICGAGNKAMVAAERLLPRVALTRIVGQVMRRWRLNGDS